MVAIAFSSSQSVATCAVLSARLTSDYRRSLCANLRRLSVSSDFLLFPLFLSIDHLHPAVMKVLVLGGTRLSDYMLQFQAEMSYCSIWLHRLARMPLWFIKEGVSSFRQ